MARLRIIHTATLIVAGGCWLIATRFAYRAGERGTRRDTRSIVAACARAGETFRRTSDLAAIIAEPGIPKSRPPDPVPKTRDDQAIKVQQRFLAHCGRPDTFAILGFDQGAIATERITANKRIHEAPGVPPPRIVLSPDTARDAISSREGSIDDERCIFHLRNANRYRLAKTKKRPPHLYANEPVSPLSANRWRCARCGLKRPCETVEIPTRALELIQAGTPVAGWKMP